MLQQDFWRDERASLNWSMHRVTSSGIEVGLRRGLEGERVGGGGGCRHGSRTIILRGRSSTTRVPQLPGCRTAFSSANCTVAQLPPTELMVQVSLQLQYLSSISCLSLVCSTTRRAARLKGTAFPLCSGIHFHYSLLLIHTTSPRCAEPRCGTSFHLTHATRFAPRQKTPVSALVSHGRWRNITFL